MSGIDDIVEMVLKEAREKDRKNIFRSLYGILEEVNNKAVSILVDHLTEERRKKEDENKG